MMACVWGARRRRVRRRRVVSSTGLVSDLNENGKETLRY